MTLRVLLADDEPLALQRLAALLATETDVTIVGAAGDGDEAAALIETEHPDLIFLDIRMPNQGGLALARSLAEQAKVEVIFVTAFDHFAAEAFDLDAVDYLLKPVQASRLSTALDRARRRRTPGPADAMAADVTASASCPALAGFWLPNKDGSFWVPIDTVDWIEAAGDYVILHTARRSHIMRSTMDAIQSQLGPEIVVRVSRSAFVRRDAVARIVRQGAGSVVVLHDRTAVRVGSTFAKATTAIFDTR
jgi:two-component system LytT family response regulator